MRDLLSLIEGAQWPNLRTIPAGTILFHGTDDDEFDPADIKGPAWFSNDNDVAAHFVNGGRLLAYRTKVDIKLPVIKNASEMEDFAEKFNIDRMSSEDVRDTARRSGIAGWIIPDNYEPGDDILICDLSDLEPMKSELSDLHEDAEADDFEEDMFEEEITFDEPEEVTEAEVVLPAPVLAPVVEEAPHHVYGAWPRILENNRAIAAYIESISSEDVSVEMIEDNYIGYKAVLKLLPIESLKEGHPDGNVRNKAKEKRYAKMDLAKQPPLMVQEWDMAVVDGNHRYRVAKAAGVTDILCYVICDEDAPIAESVEQLDEKNLPLRKGLVPHMRDQYAALICVMHPDDFLRLTVEDHHHLDRIFNDEFAELEDYKLKSNPRYNVDKYDMPFLHVVQSTGVVVGHEGRHRAAMVHNARGTSFPCMIVFKSTAIWKLTYEREAKDGSESTVETEHFPTEEDAIYRRDELNAAMNDPADKHPYWYEEFDVRRADGGGTMKGSPRSQGWDRDPWTVNDVPPEFVGQFDKAVRIPTSRMKFGVVKK